MLGYDGTPATGPTGAVTLTLVDDTTGAILFEEEVIVPEFYTEDQKTAYASGVRAGFATAHLKGVPVEISYYLDSERNETSDSD